MRVAALILFCLAAVIASSQTESDFLRHRVKLSLLDFLDPIPPSAVLGYEQFIAPNFSLMAEVGPSFIYGREKLRGYKIRTEARWYFHTYDSGDRYYLGLQGRLKSYNRHGVGNFCREDCMYRQEIDYSLQSRIWATHVSFGRTFNLSRHFSMELGTFLGWRWGSRKAADVPSDAELEQRWGFNFEPLGGISTPSIGFAIRAGFGW